MLSSLILVSHTFCEGSDNDRPWQHWDIIQSWFCACNFISIKATNWPYNFRWAWLNAKVLPANQIAEFLSLISQKVLELWSWFFACRSISVKVENWWCDFRWGWSGMPQACRKRLLKLSRAPFSCDLSLLDLHFTVFMCPGVHRNIW